MDENDEAELAQRRAYDQFKAFMDRYLIECDAPRENPRAAFKGAIWAGVIAMRIQGWFVWVVCAALIMSMAGLIGSLTLRDVLTGMRG